MTISEEKLYWILVDVAAYMHEKEQSGSMDRLLLSRICHFSLEAWYRKNDGALLSSRIKLQEETEEFIQMIDQDEGLLVVRGEQMFRFAQTTFQEYFTCQRLVYNSSNKQDVKQTLEMLVAYIRNPRYRLPLLLSFGFLSSRWSKTNFNLLCEQLIVHKATNRALPLGSLLLVEALGDLTIVPDECILLAALDHSARIHSRHDWFSNYPAFGEQLCTGLEALPAELVSRWLQLYFSKASSHEITDLSRVIHRFVDKMDNIVPCWLDQDGCLLLSGYVQYDTEENEYAVENLLYLIVQRDHKRLIKMRENSFGLQLLIRNMAEMDQERIHPLIVSIFIAIHGGVKRKEFNSLYIHRDSVLAVPLANYCRPGSDLPHEVRIAHLCQTCESIIADYNVEDVSLPQIDAFTTVLCIKGMHDRKLQDDYKSHLGFHMAIRRLKKTLFYLNQEYMFHPSSILDTAIFDDACRICTVEAVLFTSDLPSEGELNAKESMYAFMNSLSSALASLTLSATAECGLLNWCLPNCDWTKRLSDFVQKSVPPFNNARIIPDFISLLSTIVDEDSLLYMSKKTEERLDQHIRESIQNRTHIFFHTQNHPLFLLSFARAPRRALLALLIETKELDISPECCTQKLAYIYLIVECLNDFPCKEANNVRLFLLLLNLLRLTLEAHRLKHFALAYFLKLDPRWIRKLEMLFVEDSDLFSWSTAIASLNENSVFQAIKEEKHNIKAALAKQCSLQRDFELYAASVSLTHLSSLIETVKAASLAKKAQRAARKIDTPFYKLHALIYSGSSSNKELLPKLPILSFFTLAEKVSDTYFPDSLTRLNELFEDPNRIREQKVVSEALLSTSSWRSLILLYVNQCSWTQDLLMLSRLFHLRSPILHSNFSTIHPTYHQESTNASRTLYSCMYLALLTLDAQSLLKELHLHQDVHRIERLLLFHDHTRRILSELQAHTVTQYIQSTQIWSNIALIDSALREFEQAEEQTYPSLRSWLAFFSSPLSVFAWHAALLLPLDEDIPISLLVDLFTAEQDYFRMRARDLHSFHSTPLLTRISNGVIKAFREKSASFDYSCLKKVVIDRPTELNELFQSEQQFVCDRLENNPSLLALVSFEDDVTLGKSFVSEMNRVLSDSNVELLDRCAYLLSPSRCRRNSFGPDDIGPLRRFLWTTIGETSVSGIACLCIRMYYLEFWPLVQGQVDFLRQKVDVNHGPDLLGILSVISKDVATRTTYISAGDRRREYRLKLEELYNDRNSGLKRHALAELIYKHQILLLVTFVDDLFRSFNAAADGYEDLSQSRMYADMAECLCRLSSFDFHMAINQSSQSEARFKGLAYKLHYYKLLVYYGELTSPLLCYVFTLRHESGGDEEIEEIIVPLLRKVADRRVVEELYKRFRYASSLERFVAGKLILQLAQCGAISVDEASGHIEHAITDRSIQKEMKWFHYLQRDCPGHGGLVQDFRTMLLKLSHIRTGPIRYRSEYLDGTCNTIRNNFMTSMKASGRTICTFNVRPQS
jgi:hypothetical protein